MDDFEKLSKELEREISMEEREEKIATYYACVSILIGAVFLVGGWFLLRYLMHH